MAAPTENQPLKHHYVCSKCRKLAYDRDASAPTCDNTDECGLLFEDEHASTLQSVRVHVRGAWRYGWITEAKGSKLHIRYIGADGSDFYSTWKSPADVKVVTPIHYSSWV
jgi:hypothetical protein